MNSLLKKISLLNCLLTLNIDFEYWFNLSELSIPADAQNVSCLGFCGRDNCSNNAWYGLIAFNLQLSVSL